MRFHLAWILAAACFLTVFGVLGCRMFDGSESASPLAPVLSDSTGNAKVQFKLVFPDDSISGIPVGAIRAAATAKVRFRLIMVNPGDRNNPTSTLIKTVDAIGGSAEVSFTGLPTKTTIGEIVIEGGSIQGKTEFHGATDLKEGDNLLEVSPKGCGHKSDVVANVIMQIVNVPDLIQRVTTTDLAMRIESVGANALVNPTTEVYTEVFNKAVTSNTVLDQTNIVSLSKGVNGELVKSTGGSWTSAQIWATNADLKDLQMSVMGILRQPIPAGTTAMVAWGVNGVCRGVSVIDPADGSLKASFVLPEYKIILGKTFIFLPGGDVVFGGSINGWPGVVRWNGQGHNNFVAQAILPNIPWVQNFTGTEAFPYATTEVTTTGVAGYLEYDSAVKLITCIAHDPKTGLPVTFRINPDSGALTKISTVTTFGAWATSGDEQVLLTWEKMPEALGYRVTMYHTENGITLSKSYEPTTALQQTITGLRNGIAYRFVVEWADSLNNPTKYGQAEVTATPMMPIGPGPARPKLWNLVSAGARHSLAVTSLGTVKAWGANDYGQVGNGTSGGNCLQPIDVQGLTGVVSVAGGGFFSLALKNDGTVWEWGSNIRPQFDGEGSITTPRQIDGLSNIVAIAAGGAHGMALSGNGAVYTWGYSAYGQIGNGVSLGKTLVSTPFAAMTGAKAIGPMGNASYALKADGSVYSWGQDSVTNPNVPTLRTDISEPLALLTSSGAERTATTLGLTATGRIHATGPEMADQQGSFPFRNIFNAGFIGGTTSRSAAFVIRSVGRVLYGWGDDTYGQLPIDPASGGLAGGISKLLIDRVLDVSAGDWHVLALREDGSLWAWGWNQQGQIGNNAVSEQHDPVQILSPGSVNTDIDGGTPVDPGTPPAAPTEFAVQAAEESNILTWTRVSGATRYDAYWSTSNSVSTTSFQGKLSSITSPFTHASLTSGTTYYYVLTASNDAGGSAATSVRSGQPTVKVVPPTIPRYVSAGSGDETMIRTNWSPPDPNPGITGYDIYRANASDGVFISVGTVGAVTTFDDTDSTLILQAPYWYKVRAKIGTTPGEFCVAVRGVKGNIINLGAPENFQVSTGTYHDKILMTWNPVTNATGYSVFRADEREEPVEKTRVSEPNISTTSFSDTTAAVGKKYRYWVTACFHHYESPSWSWPNDGGFRNLGFTLTQLTSDGRSGGEYRISADGTRVAWIDTVNDKPDGVNSVVKAVSTAGGPITTFSFSHRNHFDPNFPSGVVKYRGPNYMEPVFGSDNTYTMAVPGAEISLSADGNTIILRGAFESWDYNQGAGQPRISGSKRGIGLINVNTGAFEMVPFTVPAPLTSINEEILPNNTHCNQDLTKMVFKVISRTGGHEALLMLDRTTGKVTRLMGFVSVDAQGNATTDSSPWAFSFGDTEPWSGTKYVIRAQSSPGSTDYCAYVIETANPDAITWQKLDTLTTSFPFLTRQGDRLIHGTGLGSGLQITDTLSGASNTLLGGTYAWPFVRSGKAGSYAIYYNLRYCDETTGFANNRELVILCENMFNFPTGWRIPGWYGAWSGNDYTSDMTLATPDGKKVIVPLINNTNENLMSLWLLTMP